MEPIATADEIRAAEGAWFAAHPGGDLMGRAADAVAEVAADVLRTQDLPGVLVVAGPGNNAGDALFAAAELSGLLGRTVPLWVWPVLEKTHADGLDAALASGAVLIDGAGALMHVGGAGLVIDGFAGIGGRAGLPDAVSAVARAADEAGVPVLAVDLPSGLVADSPVAHDSFRADVTVTFIARKLAHVAEPAASRCGEVVLVDIGVALDAGAGASVALVDVEDLGTWFPFPTVASDKYSRGVVGIDTGTEEYPGAAVLGVSGALHAGAGMVRYTGPARDAVLAAFPSVVCPLDVVNPGRVQAWVVGSGWPGADGPRLGRRVADRVPMVVDAGALDTVHWLQDPLPPGSLATPHAGELARLLGVERSAVEDDPIRFAREAAAALGASVLLKGATQYCVAPEGDVLIAEPGPAWTATAGSGDVLAGIAGALLAAGVPALRAGALAASLQARAASAVPGPRTPDEVAASGLPDVVWDLSE